MDWNRDGVKALFAVMMTVKRRVLNVAMQEMILFPCLACENSLRKRSPLKPCAVFMA